MKRRSVAVVVVLAAGIASFAFGLVARGDAGAGTFEPTAVRPGSYEINTALTTRAEVPRPRGAAGARGVFTATLNVASAARTTLTWRLTFRGLTGPATGAHIHLGAAGRSGPIVVTLCGPCRSGQRGIYRRRLSATVLNAMVAGRAYANVHTRRNPAGEIRGQIKARMSVNPYANVTVDATPALIAQGKALSDRYSCEGCHTTDGTASTGPTFKGLAGSRVRLNTGQTVVATDGYLIWSIVEPDAQIVAGYSSGVMTTAIGEIPLAQAKAITAYIKSLR